MSNDAPRSPWDRPRRDRGRAFFGSATALALVIAGAVGARLIDSSPAIAQTAPVAAGQAITPVAPAQAPFSFADLVERVAPAVVSVRVEAKLEMASGDPRTDEMMKRFFEQFGEQGPNGQGQGQDDGGEQRGEAMGSGFIIDGAGYIVTNNHVIDKAEKITVILNDGKELDAKLIGTDPGTDIALLKVEPSSPLPFVVLGDDTKLRPGDWVVAVGNPFGLGGTVTAGIVSARGRNIGAGPYTDYLQIDAPINRGNSGGPAFNVAGEVVGVNSAIYTPSGGSVGIGFAVPAGTVTKIVAQLRDHGSVNRGWLGVQIQPVDKETADAVGLSDAKGALVSMVTPGSPAEAAGFKPGDIVLKANGTEIIDNRTLARLVAELTAGQTATFDIWRDSTTKTLTATIAARDDDKIRAQVGGTPDPVNPAATEVFPGVQLSAITEEIRQAMNVPPGTEGVVVTEVKSGSDAATKGLSKGDLVVAVGNQQVTTVADATKAVADAKTAGRKSVLILVEENGVRRYLAISLS
ncbi:Periplasmic serine endoprotease DegP [Alphaproteobacteria bacterium SO-S41]|nr:Periplasmic serine endoprotease DegP [Alphaproteobacteria bacterium SO-S41]